MCIRRAHLIFEAVNTSGADANDAAQEDVGGEDNGKEDVESDEQELGKLLAVLCMRKQSDQALFSTAESFMALCCVRLFQGRREGEI